MQLTKSAEAKGIVRLKGCWFHVPTGSGRQFSSALTGGYAPVFDFIWPNSVLGYIVRDEACRKHRQPN